MKSVTVKELIEHLAIYPPDATVKLFGSDSGEGEMSIWQLDEKDNIIGEWNIELYNGIEVNRHHIR